MESALAIGGWIMIAATVLPLSRSDAWWVRIFDFPRLQVTLCFIAIVAMYLLVREDPSLADNLFLGLLGVCLAYQLKRMYPYTPLARVMRNNSRLTAKGVLWHTRRLSWDGFDGLRVAGDEVTGEAWSPLDDQWHPFRVDIRTGRATGGSFSNSDSERWERLALR